MRKSLPAFLMLVLAGAYVLPAASGAPLRAEYLPGSTKRIAQVTGDYDPQGLAHVNNTVPWGVNGVDLGANTEHDGKLFFFFGDVPKTQHPRPGVPSSPAHDADLVAYTTDVSPEPNGIHLIPVLRSDGLFDPFQLRPQIGSPPFPLLTNQTPTGAFSYNGRAYVFAVENHDPNVLPYGFWVSYLSSSCEPTRSGVFDIHSRVSQGNKARFLQVAPWVVKNAEIPGLPSSQGDGLIMIGHAGLQVSLAWMPLVPGRHPDPNQIQYWLGDPVGPPDGDTRMRRTSAWSPPGNQSLHEELAKPLFHTQYGWTSLSVGRIKENGLWILLSQKGFSPTVNPDGPIVARVAATPWELSQADEVILFDPRRDDPQGQFLHFGGFAYGAYLLNRYTRWHAGEQIVTLWYLMSTFSPYQVQLMRSQIRITR
jgi:hypothetical protein